MQLKIRDSLLTCKVTNRCLNFHEQVEAVESNKGGPIPSPVITIKTSGHYLDSFRDKRMSNGKI